MPEEFAAASDFDGDGKTTAADYLLLKRYILFGEVDASSLE
ncbi:MAG: dockerin type I domain-containing protein [Acutalibacteraceae bacterium]